MQGIVLAGGASTRMGRPKALLPLGGVPLARRLVGLFQGFCDEVFVVTGEHDAEIRMALPELAPLLVYNPEHEAGMFSSLRAGLRRCGAERVLFSPVDFAGVRPRTVAELVHVQQTVVKPRWQGKSGHPVLIGGEAITALLAAPEAANAKDVLSHYPARYVDVEDRGVAEDCDTPEDYARLCSWWTE